MSVNTCEDHQRKIKRMKDKLTKYKAILKDLESDSEEEIIDTNIHITQDSHGNPIKLVQSTLGDEFIVLETGKNMKEVSMTDLQIINEQENLYKCEMVKQRYKENGGILGWTSYITKLFIPLL
jgi:hypothetical protein